MFKFNVQNVLHSQGNLCSRCRHWLTALSVIRWSKCVVISLKQSFFHMIIVTDPAAVHTLLQNAPHRSRRLTEAIDQFFLVIQLCDQFFIGNSAVCDQFFLGNSAV